MKGLLLKDIYVVAKQIGIFMVILPIALISVGGEMLAFCIFLSATLPMTSISYDEQSKWNELSVMMPFSKFELVFSKYLLGYICIFIAYIICTIGELAGNDVLDNNIDTVTFAVIATLIFQALITPLFLKLGAEKGRFIFFGIMIVISSSGTIMRTLNSDLLQTFLTLPSEIFLVCAVMLNIISIIISRSILENKT